MRKAIHSYEEALRLDPGFARAWLGLSEVHIHQADKGEVPIAEGYRKARLEVEKALKLDANLAGAHAQLAYITMTYDWDWSRARAGYERALALEPRNADILDDAATLAATLGRFDEAVGLSSRAVENDPLNEPALYGLGRQLRSAGRLDEAEAAFRKLLELDPDYPSVHRAIGRVYLARKDAESALREMEQEKNPFWRRHGLALAYHALGREREADALLAELVAKDAESWAYQIAQVHAYRGEANEAFAWLERAYAQKDPGLPDIKGDPLMEGLKGDPRYAALLGKLRLPL
jgi:tetratricopeptide (TPR) repeat protein